MKNENQNEEAVSPVIATILMVAITVVLAGVLYVWASSLADQDASFEPRVISGEDAGASGDLTTDGTDALIRIDFTKGSEVNWGYVNVQITVEGVLEPMNCGNSKEAADSGNLKCYLQEFGNTEDQVWTAGDGAMLYENEELCSAACDIEVRITNSQTDDPLAPGFTAKAE